MSAKKIVKGKDIRKVQKYITLDGERLPLVFSNYTYYLAEDIYEKEYGRDVSFTDILKDVEREKIRGLMALTYAALIAGENDMPDFKEYMNSFDLEAMSTISEEVIDGMAESLPDVDDDESKNA